MDSYTIDIRPRRQTTLPSVLLDTLGLTVGDSLVATIGEDEIVLRPKKRVALDALVQLQKAVKSTKVNQETLQKNLLKIRKNLHEKNTP